MGTAGAASQILRLYILRGVEPKAVAAGTCDLGSARATATLEDALVGDHRPCASTDLLLSSTVVIKTSILRRIPGATAATAWTAEAVFIGRRITSADQPHKGEVMAHLSSVLCTIRTARAAVLPWSTHRTEHWTAPDARGRDHPVCGLKTGRIVAEMRTPRVGTASLHGASRGAAEACRGAGRLEKWHLRVHHHLPRHRLHPHPHHLQCQTEGSGPRRT